MSARWQSLKLCVIFVKIQAKGDYKQQTSTYTMQHIPTFSVDCKVKDPTEELEHIIAK